ncbi:hypothetical protein Ciccas_009493 [Cichlidogyrus casuarinus]|uniref:LITAF domain-containing protein n=1 Tax=Cichlidogyrus casuarinus TaxID=1844966 RepID=A0ABD2PWW3_9PLAT
MDPPTNPIGFDANIQQQPTYPPSAPPPYPGKSEPEYPPAAYAHPVDPSMPVPVATAVVVALDDLGSYPCTILCPHCHFITTTRVEENSGLISWFLFVFFCLLWSVNLAHFAYYLKSMFCSLHTSELHVLKMLSRVHN